MDAFVGFDVMVIYYFLIGIIVGFLSSTMGLGGSILAILILLFDMDNSLSLEFTGYDKVRTIIANTMVAMVATNSAVALRKKSTDQFDKKILFGVLMPSLIAAVGTTLLIINYDMISLYTYTLLFMLMMGYTCYIIFKTRESGLEGVCRSRGTLDKVKTLLAGISSGGISALTGTESSPIIVPMLNEKCGLSISRSVALFSMVFYIISLAILVGYLFAQPAYPLPFKGPIAGYVIIMKSIPMALGAFITAYLGYDIFRQTNIRYVAYITTFILSLFTLRVFFMDIIKPLY